MRRDLKRRLQAKEPARMGTTPVEVWIEMADGLMLGPRGEMISRDEFEVRCSRLGTVLVLPDNGRDNIRGTCRSTGE